MNLTGFNVLARCFCAFLPFTMHDIGSVLEALHPKTSYDISHLSLCPLAPLTSHFEYFQSFPGRLEVSQAREIESRGPQKDITSRFFVCQSMLSPCHPTNPFNSARSSKLRRRRTEAIPRRFAE